ncbi:MAG: MarR family transcriptional regulator [Bacteroidota bacterium]|nr:MarR family transcriptional regulator [Bacteroidota bacterium]
MITIEEAIKQKKFNSEHHKLMVNLLYTSSWVERIHQRFFKGHGITSQQYNVLRILRGQYPNSASVGIVLDRMIDKASNITRLVDKLAAKKYVTRTENPENRRMQQLLITQKGLDFLLSLDPLVELQINVSEKITNAEAKLLNNMLDKLRD